MVRAANANKIGANKKISFLIAELPLNIITTCKNTHHKRVAPKLKIKPMFVKSLHLRLFRMKNTVNPIKTINIAHATGFDNDESIIKINNEILASKKTTVETVKNKFLLLGKISSCAGVVRTKNDC